MAVEVTLAEVISEGSTEAVCQPQVVTSAVSRSGRLRISLLEARERADSQKETPGLEVDCQ